MSQIFIKNCVWENHQPWTVAPHDEVSHTNPHRPGPCPREADKETSGRTMANRIPLEKLACQLF